MYERLNKSAEDALAYRISQPLAQQEIQQITDELEGMIATAGKIKVLIDLQAFPFADLGGLWEDLKFDVKHFKDIERLALVGGSEMQQWSVRFFSTLTLTTSRCFDEGQVDEAWKWLTES
ncbi:MAG: STAS/SEC14 domain-containing protein [Pelovirga sp.]